MRIIIVGAGEVGYHIAGRLASENKKVVVIDTDPDAVRHMTENLDVMAILGSGSSPRVLEEAGIREAQILLAVTDSDEINLVACLMTSLLSPATKKLARLRNADFDAYHPSFREAAPYIDMVINPEIEVVKTIHRLIRVPGAVDVGALADGRVLFVGVGIDNTSPMAGVCLKDFPERFGDVRPLIAAIVRQDSLIIPRGDDRLKPEDVVYFISERDKLAQTIAVFGKTVTPLKRVMIIGGGRIGHRLAMVLEEEQVSVKVIEKDKDRCRFLAGSMSKAIILNGDGSDKKLLREEGIQDIDAVVALTHDEESNILISLLAKNLGARNAITKVNTFSYYPLMATIGLEKMVSPRLSAISSILQEVRKGKILSAVSVLGENAEVIEALAMETSEITRLPIRKLAFPKGAILLCVIRDDAIMIPSGESRVKPGDRLVLFAKKHAVTKLEKLLTVKLEYF